MGIKDRTSLAWVSVQHDPNNDKIRKYITEGTCVAMCVMYEDCMVMNVVVLDVKLSLLD